MTTERAWVVGLPADDRYSALVKDVASAAGRSRKAEPGGRLDIARFEALSTRLEQAALSDADAVRFEVAVPDDSTDFLLWGTDPSQWSGNLPVEVTSAALTCVTYGTIPVFVIDPFGRGATELGVGARSEDPAERWDAGGLRGSRAVEARFRAQFFEALEGGGTRRAAIMPSGVQHIVVAETLREFVAVAPGSVRVDAPVAYRDGSRAAHPFALRSLPLRDHLPTPSLDLRFALLSIRHAEMDVVVDGAWLRNTEISRPRKAAETDDLVYAVSREQLDYLCRGEDHVRLSIYQTGLETAVVGFYRAVTDHLLEHPGSVSVLPMYFVNRMEGVSATSDSGGYRMGTAWAT